MAGLRSLVWSLAATSSVAAKLEFQRAGMEAAAHRWAAWSSIPGSFLSLPPAGAKARSQMLEMGEGLGLFVCTEGDGKTYPKAGDKLTMHYVGKLTKDDSQFDSSRDRGSPFTFTIGEGEVIKGWDAGVMKMSLGERGILQVPSADGYGSRGAGGKIPPNADLYFDVELLAINGVEKPEKLPEQGYEGKKVAHKNMETCTNDWRREYGPKAGKEGPCQKGEEKPKEKPEPEPKKVKPEKSGSLSTFTFSWAALALCVVSVFS